MHWESTEEIYGGKKSTNLYASDLPLMYCKAVGKEVRCPSVQFPHCCACLIKRKLANGKGQRHFNLLLHWPCFADSFNNIHCVTLLGDGQRLYMPLNYFTHLQNNALLHLVYGSMYLVYSDFKGAQINLKVRKHDVH